MCRRENLFRTLDSLLHLDLPQDLQRRIIVSNNDQTSRLDNEAVGCEAVAPGRMSFCYKG